MGALSSIGQTLEELCLVNHPYDYARAILSTLTTAEKAF